MKGCQQIEYRPPAPPLRAALPPLLPPLPRPPPNHPNVCFYQLVLPENGTKRKRSYICRHLQLIHGHKAQNFRNPKTLNKELVNPISFE